MAVVAACPNGFTALKHDVLRVELNTEDFIFRAAICIHTQQANLYLLE